MHRGEEIEVRIRRGEKDLVFHASPRIETKPGEGALGVHLAETGVERRGFFGAVARGFFEAASIFWQTIRSFYDLLRNLFLAGAIPEDVAGPVGIFAIAQETGKLGLLYLLQLLALISVNLSVLNCVPFPALDGGRFFLIMLEKLRGRPISLKTEALVNGLGFVFLMLLIAGVTIQDIARLL
jgi:regulator of sigma E protease